MAGKSFSVHVDIGGRLNASLGNAVRRADAQVSTLGRSIAAINTRTNETIRSLGTGLANAGRRVQDVGRNFTASVSAPMGMLGAVGFNAAYAFEKTSNAVQAVGSLTDEQIGKLRNYTKELNAAFPYANSEIMGAAEELSKAGFNFDQVLGSLRSTLNLGLAGDIDLKSSSDIASNILTSMNLPRATAEEAALSLAKVVDSLAYAANRSNTDVRLMGETFKYVGPMARAAGLSIAEVSALSMAMANNGIKGSEAGVAMRSALVRMVRPTKPMIAALSRLNVNLGEFVKSGREISAMDIVSSLEVDGIDASGAKKAISRILSSDALQADPAKMIQRITSAVSDALGSTSIVDADKISDSVSAALTSAGSEVDFLGFVTALKKSGANLGDIARIFDARQGSRLITLLMEADLAAAAQSVETGSAGFADGVAAIRMKGVVGDLASLTAAWENLWVTIGESGALRDVGQAFQTISSGLERVATTSPALIRLATWGAMATIALGPFLVVAGGAARVIAPLAVGLLSLGRVATIGLATRLTAVAGGVRALAVASMLGAASRLRSMAAGLVMLSAAGGGKAVLGAVAGGIASFGKSVISFPVVALRGIGSAAMLLVANPIGIAIAAIVTALTALGVWVYNNWEGIKSFFAGFGDGLRTAMNPQVVGAFDKVSSALGSIFSWVNQLLGPLQATNGEWRSWGETVGGAVAGAVNAVARAIETVIGLFSSAIEKAEAFATALSNISGNGPVGATAVGVGHAGSDPTRAIKAGDPAAALLGSGAARLDGQRALGGPVRRGGSYLVGERGPEIFNPGQSGNIIPNNRINSLLQRAEKGATASRGAGPAPAGGNFTIHAPITVSGVSGDPWQAAKEFERQFMEVVRKLERKQAGKLWD